MHISLKEILLSFNEKIHHKIEKYECIIQNEPKNILINPVIIKMDPITISFAYHHAELTNRNEEIDIGQIRRVYPVLENNQLLIACIPNLDPIKLLLIKSDRLNIFITTRINSIYMVDDYYNWVENREKIFENIFIIGNIILNNNQLLFNDVPSVNCLKYIHHIKNKYIFDWNQVLGNIISYKQVEFIIEYYGDINKFISKKCLIHLLLDKYDIDLITQFFSEPRLDFLVKIKKTFDNILHYLLKDNKFLSNLDFFIKIISLLKETNEENFNRLKYTQNKKKEYPISILLKNMFVPYYLSDENFTKLILIQNELMIQNELDNIKIILSLFRDLSIQDQDQQFDVTRIDHIIKMIVSLNINENTYIYMIDLLISYKSDIIINKIIEHFNLIQRFENVSEYVESYYLNHDAFSFNNDKITRELFDIINKFNNINFWYSCSDDFKSIDSKISEDNRPLLLKYAQLPKFFSDRSIDKNMIKKYIKYQDINGNTILHHFAIRVINPNDMLTKAYTRFYGIIKEIIKEIKIDLFLIENNFKWKVIDIIACIPDYKNKPLDKLFDKVNEIVKILIDYYKNFDESTCLDHYIMFYRYKLQNNYGVLQDVDDLLKILNKFETININFSKINFYKYNDDLHLINTRIHNEDELLKLYGSLQKLRKTKIINYQDMTQINEDIINNKNIGILFPTNINTKFYLEDDIFISSLRGLSSNKYYLKAQKYKKKYLDLKNKLY